MEGRLTTCCFQVGLSLRSVVFSSVLRSTGVYTTHVICSDAECSRSGPSSPSKCRIPLSLSPALCFAWKGEVECVCETEERGCQCWRWRSCCLYQARGPSLQRIADGV